MAARRGGIKTVVIPKENERDLKEMPDNIKEHLDIKPVKWIDEVLSIALESMPEPLSDSFLAITDLSLLRTGANVLAAMQVAREVGPGHTVVTMLCDRGERYLSVNGHS